MIVTSNLIQTPKVVTIDQNRWSRSVKFTGHDLLEWVVTVDQNTHRTAKLKMNRIMMRSRLAEPAAAPEALRS